MSSTLLLSELKSTNYQSTNNQSRHNPSKYQAANASIVARNSNHTNNNAWPIVATNDAICAFYDPDYKLPFPSLKFQFINNAYENWQLFQAYKNTIKEQSKDYQASNDECQNEQIKINSYLTVENGFVSTMVDDHKLAVHKDFLRDIGMTSSSSSITYQFDDGELLDKPNNILNALAQFGNKYKLGDDTLSNITMLAGQAGMVGVTQKRIEKMPTNLTKGIKGSANVTCHISFDNDQQAINVKITKIEQHIKVIKPTYGDFDYLDYDEDKCIPVRDNSYIVTEINLCLSVANYNIGSTVTVKSMSCQASIKPISMRQYINNRVTLLDENFDSDELYVG